MNGVYQGYPPEFVNHKLEENTSQDLAEKTDDAQTSSNLRKKRAAKHDIKQQGKMKKIENLTSISPNNESESLDPSV